MPKISVIIPTYNRSDVLPRAINSVLNQTCQDFEIIVADDGSNDNTKSIVIKLQKKDNRIKYFYQENSGGPAKPLNLGIKNSIGEYITFLGGDDEFAPTYLEELLEPFIITNNKVDITSCGGKIPKYKNIDGANIIKTALSHKPIIAGIMFFKRQLIDKVGFYDEKLKIAEDTDLCIRFAKTNCNFKFIHKQLYLIHYHKSSITKNIQPSEKIKILKYFIQKHFYLYEKDCQSYSTMLGNIGAMYICDGNISDGRKYIIMAIKKYPFDFKNCLMLILSLLGKNVFYYFHKLKRLRLQS